MVWTQEWRADMTIDPVLSILWAVARLPLSIQVYESVLDTLGCLYYVSLYMDVSLCVCFCVSLCVLLSV